MKPIAMTLPLAPSSNNAYKNAGKKGRVLTREGKEYKENCATVARLFWKARPPLDGDVAMVGTVYLNHRSRDLTNAVKLMEDSLKGICYHDDKQVAHLDLRRKYDRGDPRVEFTVGPYTEPQTRAA